MGRLDCIACDSIPARNSLPSVDCVGAAIIPGQGRIKEPKLAKEVVVIPARYGSTRLPGKPLEMLAGKPMIQRVYERAKSADRAHPLLDPPTHAHILKTSP